MQVIGNSTFLMFRNTPAAPTAAHAKPISHTLSPGLPIRFETVRPNQTVPPNRPDAIPARREQTKALPCAGSGTGKGDICTNLSQHLCMIIQLLVLIQPPPLTKKFVEQRRSRRYKNVSGPCSGKAVAEKGKGSIPVFLFAVQVAGDEEKQRQMEEIEYKAYGKITAVSENDRNDADSFYNIPVGGT